MLGGPLLWVFTVLLLCNADIDLEEGEISFSRNGCHMGTAFTGERQGLTPAAGTGPLSRAEGVCSALLLLLLHNCRSAAADAQLCLLPCGFSQPGVAGRALGWHPTCTIQLSGCTALISCSITVCLLMPYNSVQGILIL